MHQQCELDQGPVPPVINPCFGTLRCIMPRGAPVPLLLTLALRYKMYYAKRCTAARIINPCFITLTCIMPKGAPVSVLINPCARTVKCIMPNGAPLQVAHLFDMDFWPRYIAPLQVVQFLHMDFYPRCIWPSTGLYKWAQLSPQSVLQWTVESLQF